MAEKIRTNKREPWNLTKRLHRQTLTIEYDQNMDEYIYRQSPVKSPDIKNIRVVTLTWLIKQLASNLML